MNCEAATNLISAKLDGEIAASDQAALDAHLAGCPACRATMDVLRAQDSDLQRAFAPRRAAATAVAEAAIERIHREQTFVLRPRRFPLLNTLLAAAAGFAVAFLVFQPWKSPPRGGNGGIATSQPSPSNAVAHLALATGTIEMLPPGQSEWQVMPTGAAIVPDSRIRTPDKVRCEIVMGDDSTIRLNSNSEVLVTTPRRFDLRRGQMWSRSAGVIPFTVAVAQASITALGTEFDVQADAQQATLTVIEGSTRVFGKGGERVVESGKKVRIVDGMPGESQFAHDIVVTTRWVNELAMMRGRDNPELQKRVDGLLAAIGNEKMAYMMEDEIKALGDHCVLPLTRFIQSPLSASNARRRQQAARIASEMSQPWSIPEMIGLLKDNDGEVRYHAARALQRLAGQSMGRSPEQWREQVYATTYNQWIKWWQDNRERYPAGPMGPTPAPMPINAPPKPEVKAKARG